jgi:hypothetical protein
MSTSLLQEFLSLCTFRLTEVEIILAVQRGGKQHTAQQNDTFAHENGK